MIKNGKKWECLPFCMQLYVPTFKRKLNLGVTSNMFDLNDDLSLQLKTKAGQDIPTLF